MFHFFCKIRFCSSWLKYGSAHTQVQVLTNLSVALEASPGTRASTGLDSNIPSWQPALWYRLSCLTIVRVSQPWIRPVSQEQFILLGDTGTNCWPWEGNTSTPSTLLHLTATANIIDFCFPPSSAFKTRITVYWLQRMSITTFLKAHKIRRVESLQQPWRRKFQNNNSSWIAR